LPLSSSEKTWEGGDLIPSSSVGSCSSPVQPFLSPILRQRRGSTQLASFVFLLPTRLLGAGALPAGLASVEVTEVSVI
jgi:hypothetical protein